MSLAVGSKGVGGGGVLRSWGEGWEGGGDDVSCFSPSLCTGCPELVPQQS